MNPGKEKMRIFVCFYFSCLLLKIIDFQNVTCKDYQGQY